MQEIGSVLALVLTYYLTFALMGIGFGTMFAGKDGAAAVARFFLLRPLQWAVQQARVLGIGLIAAGWRFLLHRVADPFILAVERGVIWLITRKRGWLRR